MMPRRIRQGFDTLHRALNTSLTIQWGAVVAAVDQRRRFDGLTWEELLDFGNTSVR